MKVGGSHNSVSAAPTDVPLLRRTLTRLVYRDAAQRYGAGLVLVMLPLIYLFREWPPWEIRDTLHAAAAPTRAWILAAAHALYWVVTAPLVRQLLASGRLRWWWSLPLPRRFWVMLHLRHLLGLNATWIAATAYGTTTIAQRDGLAEAIAVGSSFAAIILCGQIVLAVSGARPLALRTAALATMAGLVTLAVVTPSWAVLPFVVAGTVALSLRLGRPLPEPNPSRHGHAGGHPIVALARLSWLAARRRSGVALAWGIAIQLGAVGLVALGIVHVGEREPEVARSLLRGMAMLCGLVGASLVLLATRHTQGDRPRIRTWGVEPSHERGAQLVLGLVGTVPAMLVGAPLLLWASPVGAWWPFDLGIAALWATVSLTTRTYTDPRSRTVDTPVLPRMLLRLAVMTAIVVGIGTTLVLIPLIFIDLWRLPRLQRIAAHAAARFETARPDDHHP